MMYLVISHLANDKVTRNLCWSYCQNYDIVSIKYFDNSIISQLYTNLTEFDAVIINFQLFLY